MVAIRICRSARALGVAALLVAPGALARDEAQASEAARHFDRGFLLAQQGSLEAAIAEFKRAYALSPHPSVLYNLGQAYAASGRAVEAVQALRRYLEQADPKQDNERRAQASAVIDYQSQRIGSLRLEIEPAGAEVTLDGEALGKAPINAPLELTAGAHGLVVVAAGHATQSARVEIVGKGSTSLRVRLEPSGAASRLRVSCPLPDVMVSGAGLPPTRLERGGDLVLAHPPATLRFERPGFVPVTRSVGDGSRPIDCGLGVPKPGAELVPVVVEAPAGVDVRVDGEPFGRGSLVPGRHALALSGAGLEASETLIEVGPGRGSVFVDARESVAAMVEERRSRRRLQLTLAIAASAASVVSLGTASVLYAVNQDKYRDWRDDGARLAARMASAPGSVTAGEWNELLERENALRNRDAAALGLAVAGGGLLATGAVLWLTAPRPATAGVTLRIGRSTWLGYAGVF